MKSKIKFLMPLAVGVIFFGTSSCMKCEECHYDGPNGQVELGELCDDELQDKEQNGYATNDTIYEVHCHEH